MHTIGLLCLATNEKYHKFIRPFFNSARRYFLQDHYLRFFLFTDSKSNYGKDVTKIPIRYMGHPLETLMRYHYFTKRRDELSEMDYLFYSDIDMLFCNDVGDEVLGDLVVTQHPGYINMKGTYEYNDKSLAYLDDEKYNHYFCGGFNGGKTDKFLKMSQKIKENIDTDFSNGIVAIWHDESHLNRYMYDNKPSKILSPSYCYPEPPSDEYYKTACWGRERFVPKLMALDKLNY